MSEITDKDYFLNPVGVVEPSGEYTHIYGTGGSVRHTGSFTPDNPALELLLSASKNQDKDALYNLAIQQEIELANYNRERADKRADLLEQRAYDDPAAVLARQRAAGYNPTLAGSGGSSSGGSSATVAPSDITTPTPQVATSNHYDNLSKTFEGINAASNFISSITNLGTGIGTMLTQAALRPSQQRIAQSEAQVAESTANSVISNARIGNIQQLAQLTTPESTDDEYTQLFDTLGTPQAERVNLRDSVRYYHNNPALKAIYEENLAKETKAAAFNKHYTSAFYSKLFEYLAAADTHKAVASSHQAQVDEAIAAFVNNSSYAQDMGVATVGDAANMAQQSANTSQQLSLQATQLRESIRSYTNWLKYHKDERKKVVDKIAELSDDPDVFNRIDSRKCALLDACNYQLMVLDTQGTQDFGAFQKAIISCAKSAHMTEFTRYGKLGGNWFNKHAIDFLNLTYDGLMSDGNEIGRVFDAAINFIPGIGGVAVQAFKAAHANDPKPTTTSIRHSYIYKQ